MADFWQESFLTNWSRNYFNHYNGKVPAQTALEPHVAALGEIYQAQRPFPGFHRVADFVIPGRRLIIELDGKSHRGKSKAALEQQAKDKLTDDRLKKNGWTVIRIPNEAVFDDALGALTKALAQASQIQKDE